MNERIAECTICLTQFIVDIDDEYLVINGLLDVCDRCHIAEQELVYGEDDVP